MGAGEEVTLQGRTDGRAEFILHLLLSLLRVHGWQLQEPGCPRGCTETGQEATGRREYREMLVGKTGK